MKAAALSPPTSHPSFSPSILPSFFFPAEPTGMAEGMDACGESFEVEDLIEVEKGDGIDDNKEGEVDEIKELTVGMIFSSFQEAKNFYDDYAQSKGFSIRTRSTYKDRRGPDVSSALLVCTCEGFNQKIPKGDDEGKIRRGTIVRSGCKASMRVTNIRGTTAWKVTVFSNQHNHELFTQSKGDPIKSNKRKSRAVKSPTEAMRSCDVYRQATRLAHMAGRSEEIYQVIMAVMEETFKKVSQMEKDSFNNENDEICFNKTSDNPTKLGSTDLETPTEQLICKTNDDGRNKRDNEMDGNIDRLDNGLMKWKPVHNDEDYSFVP